MKYVIFSSQFSLILLGGIVLIYLLYAVLGKIFKKANTVNTILAVVNVILHLAFFGIGLYIKATVAELFFVMIASAAIALTVTKPKKEG